MVFPTGGTVLRSHKEPRILTSTSYCHWLLFFKATLIASSGIVTLICISLLSNDVEIFSVPICHLYLFFGEVLCSDWWTIFKTGLFFYL